MTLQFWYDLVCIVLKRPFLVFIPKDAVSLKYVEYFVHSTKLYIPSTLNTDYRVCQLDMLHFEVPDGQHKLT